MSEYVSLDSAGLQTAAAGWHATVPVASFTTTETPSDSTDAATAAVLAAMAHWPVEHVAMAAQRETSAAGLHAAATAADALRDFWTADVDLQHLLLGGVPERFISLGGSGKDAAPAAH